MRRALLIVDLQNDFLPGGALAVREGDQLPPLIDQLMTLPFDTIIATKDWHPPHHKSFAKNHPGRAVGDRILLNGIEQILWPIHCVQHTQGSEFAPRWNSKKVDEIFYKGMNPDIDSYSAFFDNKADQSTGLDDYLKRREIEDLYVVGLATDYCVKYSVCDALRLGYHVYVITDACRAVNIHEDDERSALEQIEALGAHLILSNQLLLESF